MMVTWFLILIYLAFISLGLPDSLLGAAWPVIWPEIDSSLGSAGLVAMVIAGGTIASSLASGKMIQWLGTGKLTLFSCLLTATALLGFSMAPSIVWLIGLAVPLGLGGGAVDAALNHYVADNYKAHHMSWLHCFWGVGATAGPIIMAGFIASPYSWRGGYTAVAILQFVLVAILLITLPLWKRVAAIRDSMRAVEQKDEVSEPDEESRARQVNVFRLKGIKPTLLSFLLYCGAEAMVGLWGASYLVETREVNPETAAGWIALYYGGITVGRLITGFITFKVSNRLLIRFGQWIAMAGCILFFLPLSDSFCMVGFVMIGLGFAPIYPGLLHETPARFGKENSAKLMGYQMAVAYTGSTFIPPLFGLIVTLTSTALFPSAVFIILLLMLVSVELVNRILTAARGDHTRVNGN